MKKILAITSLASITTFGLFVFMAYLVNNDQIVVPEPTTTLVVDFAQLPEERPAAVKEPFKNDPPPAPKPMPQTFEPTVETEVQGGYHYENPPIKLAGGNTNITLDNNHDGEARPVVRINPKYPISALRDGIEGWVQLRFDINALGAVTNVEVIDAEPKRVFDKAAKQALRKWKYRAKSENGNTVAQKGLTVQLDFNMEQS